MLRAEKVNKADYTDDSVKSFEQALTAAKAVLEDTYATQAEVDAAVNTLKQAADALVKKTTPTPDPTPTPNPNPTPTPNPTPGKDDTAKVPAKGSKDYRSEERTCIQSDEIGCKEMVQ